MGVLQRAEASAGRFLRPGELVEATFLGQTLSQWFQGLAAGAGILIAVTLTSAMEITGPFSYLVGFAIAVVVAGGVFMLFNRNRVVVATNERLLFLQAAQFRPARATAVLGELTRTTLVGPPNGRTWSIVFGVADNNAERIYEPPQV